MRTSKKGIRKALWAFWISSLVGIPVAGGFVLGPTSPGKWGSPDFGTGATITYSYQSSGSLDVGQWAVDLDVFMPVGYIAEIEAAFDAWASIADLRFVEVEDSGLPFNHPEATIGDIRITGEFMDGPFGALAHGFFPPQNGSTAAGDIHFDKEEPWKIGFGGGGFDIFQVFAHELGHALGLQHTDVPGSLMNPFYSESFSGLQADDIAGAISLYGPVAVATSPIPESGSTILLLSIVFLALRVGLRLRDDE